MRILGDYVLILRDESSKKTEAGLFIPEQSVKNKNTGSVIDTGPGIDDSPMTVKKDDKVAFAPHAGSAVVLKDIEYLLMRVSDIYYIK